MPPLRALPQTTIDWLEGLTPEKVERLQELEQLADEVDLMKLKEVLELYQNTQIVKRFGTRSLVVFLAGFAFVVTFIETFNRIIDYILKLFGGGRVS